MKICHITFDHSWNDTRVYKREILSQREAGFEVLFFGWDKPSREINDGVQFISYARHRLCRRERIKLMLTNRKIIKTLLDLNADVYQFHDFTLLEVGRKLKKAGCHVIFDSHENYLETIPDKIGKNGVLKKICTSVLNLYYRRVVGRFDAVFTVSPNFVERLKEFNPHSYLVPNYPSVKNYITPAEVNKENVFVYQGTVYGFSNQEAIVKAINQVEASVKYRIIGNVSEEKEIIEKNDENKRVEILGWVEKDKLDILLRQSIAGIVVFDYVPECSYEEGQIGSNKIFEYMLNGLPVICTDFKLWRQMIIDRYQCGICVKPGNIKQIKDAIDWLLSNPDDAKKMGERGRIAVLQEFNWEKGMHEYLAHYEYIVNGHYSK